MSSDCQSIARPWSSVNTTMEMYAGIHTSPPKSRSKTASSSHPIYSPLPNLEFVWLICANDNGCLHWLHIFISSLESKERRWSITPLIPPHNINTNTTTTIHIILILLPQPHILIYCKRYGAWYAFSIKPCVLRRKTKQHPSCTKPNYLQHANTHQIYSGWWQASDIILPSLHPPQNPPRRGQCEGRSNSQILAAAIKEEEAAWAS